jgi:hypothetical protein
LREITRPPDCCGNYAVGGAFFVSGKEDELSEVWVQALRACRYREDGVDETAHPGDWFRAGRGDAKRWMAEGKVDIPDPKKKAVVQELHDCGVSLRGEDFAVAANMLCGRFPGLEISMGEEPTHPRSLLWDADAGLRTELVPIGLGLLRTWHVAVPLLDYDTLARDIGGEDDRRLTEEAVRDLRVPVYDVRVIFARKCRTVDALLAAWGEEKERGVDERLAFLRALHRVVPLVNALPPTWIEEQKQS